MVSRLVRCPGDATLGLGGTWRARMARMARHRVLLSHATGRLDLGVWSRDLGRLGGWNALGHPMRREAGLYTAPYMAELETMMGGM